MEPVPPRAPRDLTQRDHRRLIGFLGLFLPATLYLVAGARTTDGFAPWVLLDSVSQYYYTGAVPVFAGVLFALSLFLFTYRGYEGEVADRVVGRVAGTAAVGVALFPTEVAPTLTALGWWTPRTGHLHLASAVTLFGCFILFAGWLFRRSKEARRDRPLDKQVRDAICLACAVVMAGAVVWAIVGVVRDTSIFWPETVAIEAFAISWLAKGEAHLIVRNLARQIRGTS